MSEAVPDRDDWFVFHEAFPRPQWHLVYGWIRAYRPGKGHHEAWVEFVRHWLGRLQRTLGGGYRVGESAHFQILAEHDERGMRRLLDEYEFILSRMLRVLGETYDGESRGKFVALRFGDWDDYYHYISHFYPDGEHITSGGIFLYGGYYHMAYGSSTPEGERQVRVHELAHNLMAHLPMPLWLNEALAQAFDHDLAGLVDRFDWKDLHSRRGYWNRTTVQDFWSGASFSCQNGSDLSYALAKLLLDFIHRDIGPSPENFRRFVQRADWHDAGDIAAREHLGISLGELISGYLGPGDWEPEADLASKARPREELDT